MQETGTRLSALNASTGATDWSVNLGGSLGFGTPAYDGRRVFAVNYDGVVTAFVASSGHLDPPLILAKSTGAVVATFASIAAPAFDSTNMYTLDGGNLVAVAPSGSPNRWTFKNGSLVTAPVASNGVVYIGSSSGKVYGVSASSGAKVWSGTAGTFIAGPDYDVGLESGSRSVAGCWSSPRAMC